MLNWREKLPRNRSNNDLCTPASVLDRVALFADIALDPCSNPWSQVPAAKKIQAPEECGLAADWLQEGGGLVFVNPPYGRGHMDAWAAKIASEAVRGTEILALVKGDFSTTWWQVLREKASAIIYWRKRIPFDGGSHSAGTFPSVLFYFGRAAWKLEPAFNSVADVRIL